MARVDVLRGTEFGLRASLLELSRGTERDAAIALCRLIGCAAHLSGDAASAIARADRVAGQFGAR